MTRAIRGETEPEDRIAVLEMAWMVVMSDGEVHEYEAQLMRRLAGLLYVDDIESDALQNASLPRSCVLIALVIRPPLR